MKPRPFKLLIVDRKTDEVLETYVTARTVFGARFLSNINTVDYKIIYVFKKFVLKPYTV
jgi:hypothetical protein